MLERALKRLFLILFPLSLLLIALFLTDKKPPKQDKIKFSVSENKVKNITFLKSKCPFYLGVSFFPMEEKKQNLFTSKKPFQPPSFRNYLLSEEKFKKSFKNLKKVFKKEKLRLKNRLFVFPLALTKDNKWLISKKTFFILPEGERKELSHLTYPEIQALYERFPEKPYKLLKLETVFSYLPNGNFLFYLEGSHREKIIKNLKNLKGKTKGIMYLSSSNERLLREIIKLEEDWKVLHSFKGLTKLQIANVFYLGYFKNFPGKGFVIPSLFPLSNQSLLFLQNQKKLLFLKKPPPYNSFDQILIQKAHALISSQPKQALSIVKIKKPCLIKK